MQDNLLWENLLLVLHMWMSTVGWLFSQGVSFYVIYLRTICDIRYWHLISSPFKHS